MSKELLQKVIDKGVEGYLNEFLQDASKYYTEREDDLSEHDGNGLSDFQVIGEINFSPAEKLVVVIANVAGDLTERSGKKAQYEKAKKILKKYMRYDAGIFVFSDQAGNFRLSLVYGTPDITRLVWSNFRRFTYFVSKGLTNKTFLDRVGKCSFSSLEIIKEAFSVEKVTKDFYKQIADWYFWAVQNATFPKDAEAEANGRNNAVIRLITRLIFIWFMKERKLVSPGLFNQENISALLKSLKPDETTYYKAILQNLFFATLNTKIDERQFRFKPSRYGRNKDYMEHGIYRYESYFKQQEDMLVLFKDIPFLNGGLFDCLDWSAKESGTGTEARFDGFSDKEVGLNVPNYLFFSGEQEANLNKEYGTKNKKYRVQGLLNILQAYNFTIDENDPNDQEVALDPELLGKVFENLLASFNPETATTARKATGSYYTPREIVDYMVTQSLKQYYQTHLSDVADIDNKLEELLSPITEEPLNPFGETDSKRVVRLTEELRIVDPAVGSGAFPMGILNKLVSVLARVDHNNRLWQEAQLKAVEAVTDQLLKQKLIKQINEQFTEKNSNYGRKLYLIQKCIYGVDIQQIAIEIAKLRFFIALLVDEKIDKSKPNWGIEPLPNLDFKLMQGDSLISEFMGINLDSEDSNSYGKLMKDETDELITQYQNKKTDYQYEPDRDKKQTLKNEIEELIARIFESKLQGQKAGYLAKLKQIETRYASVPNIQERNEGIKKDTETLNRNYKFDLTQAEKQLNAFTRGQKVRPFFAWKLYFAEVFAYGGFDIVIANPPYIRQELIKELKPELKKQFQCYSGNADIYIYFYERGKQILNENGTLTYISSNKYLRSGYGEGLRRMLSNDCKICQIIDFGDSPVFEAISYPSIIVLKNTPPESSEVQVFTWQPGPPLESFASVVRNSSWLMPQKELTTRGWLLELPVALRLMEKLRKTGAPLGEYVDGRLYYGIKTGLNEAFIVDRATRDRLVAEHPSSAEVLKPFLRGKDIKRWRVNFAELYVLFIPWHFPLHKDESISGVSYQAEREFREQYPAVYRHLLKFKTQLEARNKAETGIRYEWYALQRCAATYWREFEKGMIVMQGLMIEPSFVLSSMGYYLNAPANFIGSTDQYLLGVLNSKVLWFYHRNLTISVQQGFLRIYIYNVEKLPIATPSEFQRSEIKSRVENILAAKQIDPKADTTVLENQIDHLVYEVYGLTEEEIGMVEGNTGR